MESEKKNGGDGAAAAASSGGGGVSGGGASGRLLLEDFPSDLQSDRKRFYIELKPGETTIVSWTKLLKDSGFVEAHPSPARSPERPKGDNQGEESRNECSDIVPKKETQEPNDQPKKKRTTVSGVLERNNVQATKSTKTGHARVKVTSSEKQPLLVSLVTCSTEYPSDTSIRTRHPCKILSDQTAMSAESQATTLTSPKIEDHLLNNAITELPDLNIPYANNSPKHIKDESRGMVSATMLENTILELETIAAEYRDIQNADPLVTPKSRLPRELKKKLEIVGRLAHLSRGRITDALITRLMSILGRWMKLGNLKRHLRRMAPEDLLASRAEDVGFCRIQKEVVEMIKLRTPSLEAKDEQCNVTPAQKPKYSMDCEMEDKICDFYDSYVQGMNEVKGSEIRRFYFQLSRMWPKGTMDNHGIRNAICRAKARRKMLSREQGHEKSKGKRKRKKSSNARTDDNLQMEAHKQSAFERPVNDPNASVSTFSDSVVPSTPELDQNLSAPAKRSSSPSSGSCKDPLKQDGMHEMEIEIKVVTPNPVTK